VARNGVTATVGRADGVRSSMPSLWMAIVVERACTEIWRAWGEKSEATGLRVNPAVYQAVARARPGEVERGYPLMLLGLELVPDPAVQIYEPVVIRA
jgi:hypothetical protein